MSKRKAPRNAGANALMRPFRDSGTREYCFFCDFRKKIIFRRQKSLGMGRAGIIMKDYFVKGQIQQCSSKEQGL